MKAVVQALYGRREDVLAVGDLPVPTPGTGEVRNRVRAAGVDWADSASRATRSVAGAARESGGLVVHQYSGLPVRWCPHPAPGPVKDLAARAGRHVDGHDQGEAR